MAAWPLTVLAGDIEGPAAINFGVLWSGPKAEKFKGIQFSKTQTIYGPDRIVRMKVLDDETTKTFLRTAVAGLAGGVLLGAAGLLAGAMVGGKKVTSRYGIEFDDGKRIIIADANNKPFKCLLLFAEKNKLLERDRVVF